MPAIHRTIPSRDKSTRKAGSPRLAVADNPVEPATTSHLSTHLQLPLCGDDKTDGHPPCSDYDFYLLYQRDSETRHTRLCLAHPSGDLGKPFYIDFAHGQMAHRRQFGGGRGQPLARAIGLKGGACPRVVDATAGMGRDAFVLATLGARVTLLERSPILIALLEDGLRRASLPHELETVLDPEIPARMKLISADAIQWLTHCNAEQCPDVVYLDPMYPQRSKSALVKKEMRILRALVGDDTDAGELLRIALQRAKKRVVVKRPKGAAHVIPLTMQNLRPASAVESKNTRYDIYPVNV